MKKILLTSCLALCGLCSSFAQMQAEDFQQEMEAQMAEMLELLEQSVQGGELFRWTDTTMFKMIPLDPNLSPEDYPNGDPYQLHQFLDQFLGAFGDENRQELERFFEELEKGNTSPEDSAPETQPGEQQENSPKKRQKKRKIYRL